MQAIHKLLYQGDTKPFSEPQHIFAHMVRLAQPIMTDFHSDLWHDALWLSKHASTVVPGAALHFYWSLGPTHTWLGDHPIADPYDGSVLYHFTLYLDEYTHWWTLVIDQEERTPITRKAHTL